MVLFTFILTKMCKKQWNKFFIIIISSSLMFVMET